MPENEEGKKGLKEFPSKELLETWLQGDIGTEGLQQWLDETFPMDMKDDLAQILESDTGQDMEAILDDHYKELKEELLKEADKPDQKKEERDLFKNLL